MYRKLVLFIFPLLFCIMQPAMAGVLNPGDQLTVNQVIYSENNSYFARMQSDGNFVVYRNDGTGRVIWSTNTTGLGAVRAVMQADGNFVLYTASGVARWSSQTIGSNYVFYVANTGEAVVASSVPIWQSKTGDGYFPPGIAPIVFPMGTTFQRDKSYYQSNNLYRLIFQTDGNFVLYKAGKAIWSSNTTGLGATIANIYDYELNLWDPTKGIIWQPRLDTSQIPKNNKGGDGIFLAYMPDGNLILYQPVWLFSGAGDMVWTAPGGDGPECVGDPNACNPWTIPIFQTHW